MHTLDIPYVHHSFHPNRYTHTHTHTQTNRNTRTVSHKQIHTDTHTNCLTETDTRSHIYTLDFTDDAITLVSVIFGLNKDIE